MIKVVTRLSATRSIFECFECTSLYERSHYEAKKSRIGHLCASCKSTSGYNVDQTMLKKFFTYDPDTGNLKWRLPQRQSEVGDILGYAHSGGYKSASIAGKAYLLHRLVWMFVYGYFPEQIDHINHDRQDNRLCNLREVNNTTNSKNTSLSVNSVTKVNGVSFMKSKNKFRAYIMVNRKQIHLGLYDSIEEARESRLLADIQYGFHSNHGNER